MTDLQVYTPVSALVPEEAWPAELLGDSHETLGNLACLHYDAKGTPEELSAHLKARAMTEVEIDLPIFDGMALVVGKGGQGGGIVDASLELSGNPDSPPDFDVDIDTTALGLRVSRDLLTPVEVTVEDGEKRIVEKEGQVDVPIPLGASVGFHDGDWEFDVRTPADGSTSLTLPTCEIGDTGVVVENGTVSFNFTGDGEVSPANAPDGWQGVVIESAEVHVPEVFDGAITADRLGIGTGGVTGTVGYNASGTGELSGEFLGLEGSVESVSLELRQNVPVGGSITGTVVVPYFEEELRVAVSLDAEGGFSVRVSPPPDADEEGIVRLEREGVFSVVVESVGLEIDDGTTVTLSGTIQPLVEDLPVELPGFEIEELSIDDKGNVEVEGGWLDLPDQYSVDIYGVTLEITKLGFGTTDDGEKWIGLNGGISVVEGVPAGASVEGLRIYFDGDGFQGVSLEGIGIEFEVPGTLRFAGAVSLADDEFSGAIELELIALNLSIDAQLVVGEHEEGFTYFGVYLDADLPAGIPLFSTGTGIYGFAGLFAHQMEPGKGDDQKWYDIDGGSKSWYHDNPGDGVTYLDKWEGRAGGLGLGAGVTVATLPDNGFSVTGSLLLAIVFPGPIIMLQGEADILSEGTNTSDAAFRSIAVLDNREGSFTFGMDAQYKKGGDDGALIDVRAGVEAFFSFHDPTAWHLYMGKKEPPAERIRAKALYLFTADAYFMLDADRLALGAKVGYDADWTFGPVGVVFEAWIAGNAALNWNPMHFFGELLAHGKVALKVFGFSMGLSIDARIAADVYDPFHLIGEFSVALDLPWPLPDPSVDVTLEWGPQKDVPPVPRPLEGVAVGHGKSTARWPLSREGETAPAVDGGETDYPPLVTPNYADDDLLEPGGPGVNRPDADESPPDPLPVVPPDARPRLTFARPVHDDGEVGVNHQPVEPEKEVIGDPGKGEGPIEVRYGLADVRLKKREGSSWTEIEDVYGSWAPLPKSQAGTGGATKGGGSPALSNTKLELYSKNPFDYGRHTHGAWEEGTQRLLEDYPCTVDVRCFDFEGLTIDGDFTETPDDESGATWHELARNDRPEWPTFAVQDAEERPIPRMESIPHPEWSRALVYPRVTRRWTEDGQRHEETLPARVEIGLAEPRTSVRISLVSGKYETTGTITAYDAKGPVETRSLSVDVEGGFTEETFTSEDSAVESIVVDAEGNIGIAEVCSADADLDRIGPQETSGIDHTRDELVRWADEDDVLEPNTVYRLEVDTVVEATGQDGGALADLSERWYDDDDPLTEFVYFRTGGPPGVAPEPSLPTTVDDEQPEKFATGLEDLTRYVRSTVPETVPAEGEKPLEPRPVYRAYDVGVDFSENYVETLYRMARRDLGLYLYDTNDRPVRDLDGRLVATENQWGKTDSLLLSDHDRAWLRRVRESGCMDVDENTVPLDDALSADEGVVLDPATTYEARLSPLLVRDGFDDGLGHWRQVGDGGPDWETPGHDGRSGEDAEVSGSTATLGGSPSLSALAADADAIHFPGDRNRESGNYRITGVDDAADEVTLDGEPDLGDDDRWTVAPRHALRQTAAVAYGWTDAPESTLELAGHPRLDGAMQDPEGWTDYRVEATLRADDVSSGAVGLWFRRDGSGDGYRFELDADDNAWKLLSVEGGDEAELASHTRLFANIGTLSGIDITGDGVVDLDLPNADSWVALEAGRDYRIAVEAIGPDLRVYVDGEPILSVEDDAHAAGTVGVYCRAVAEAHVPEVRVDDYRPGVDGTPAPYRFKFTTSAYANFFHQAHSFEDETWPATADVAGGSDPAAALDSAVSATDLAYADLDSLTPPGDEEARSYDAALSALAGDGPLAKLLRQRPDRVTVTRFDGDDGPLAYLLASPEPLDWGRTDLAAGHADADAFAPATPDAAKLTDATLGDDESVTLLFREATDPTGYAVDYRRSAEPGFDPTTVDERFRAEFAGSFGSRYEAIDRSFDPIEIDPIQLDEPISIGPLGIAGADAADGEEGDEGDGGTNTEGDLDLGRQFFDDLASGTGGLPSLSELTTDRRLTATTTVGGWQIEDGALVGGGSGVEDVVARGGSADEGVWTATVAAADPGEVGLLFRYAGENDHYRFSIGADAGLRLLRRRGGSTDVLWEGDRTAAPDREYRLSVVAAAGQLRGYLDGVPAFVVADPGGSGRVGVHAGRAGEVTVTELSAHTEGYESLLFADDFSGDLDAWEFEDVPPYTTQESDWHVVDERLRQTSNIYGHVGNEYHEPGTHGVAGEDDWRDYRATVKLGSGDNDALGLLVRYQDRENYYRFSMDHEREYRRLVKRVDGTTHLLWEDEVQYDSGREYLLTVECVGTTLTGYLDGEQLFEVEDDALDAGRVGLYCRANDETFFDDVRVTAPGDDWVPYYEFGAEDALPAGTRARINRDGPGSDEAGLIQRDLAPDGDAPGPLPASGVDLRVRPPEVPVHAETPGHVRRFLPADDFSDLDAKALRNADGTGVLLVPAESVDPGQLRLELTYHRDKGDQILRQAGYSDPEEAVLDVPWETRSTGGE